CHSGTNRYPKGYTHQNGHCRDSHKVKRTGWISHTLRIWKIIICGWLSRASGQAPISTSEPATPSQTMCRFFSMRGVGKESWLSLNAISLTYIYACGRATPVSAVSLGLMPAWSIFTLLMPLTDCRQRANRMHSQCDPWVLLLR